MCIRDRPYVVDEVPGEEKDVRSFILCAEELSRHIRIAEVLSLIHIFMKDMQEKIRFFGRIVSVQPRANVWRYRLDNRSHGMKGYNLFLKGVADSEDKDFSIAISEKQQERCV